ncbi:MAG: 50S ribosomal protein L23 [Caldilineae bacterium]|nr:MAG: 50S ribosomal protein L23 [Caldilineae bacterium]
MHAYEVLKRPIVTEKSDRLQDEANQYVFEVDRRANKVMVAAAIEERFGVKVLDVRIINMPAKTRRRSRKATSVRVSPWKKAIVTLAPEDSIQLFEGV